MAPGGPADGGPTSWIGTRTGRDRRAGRAVRRGIGPIVGGGRRGRRWDHDRRSPPTRGRTPGPRRQSRAPPAPRSGGRRTRTNPPSEDLRRGPEGRSSCPRDGGPTVSGSGRGPPNRTNAPREGTTTGSGAVGGAGRPAGGGRRSGACHGPGGPAPGAGTPTRRRRRPRPRRRGPEREG